MEYDDYWSRLRDLFSPLPDDWERIKEGDLIGIGGSDWRVIVAQGHAPEQALLHSEAHNLLISGDSYSRQDYPQCQCGRGSIHLGPGSAVSRQ